MVKTTNNTTTKQQNQQVTTNNQITTTTLILKQMLLKSTYKQKVSNILTQLKQQGYTNPVNKQGKPITKNGLLRLSKTMYTVGFVNKKKGWWSNYTPHKCSKTGNVWVTPKQPINQ